MLVGSFFVAGSFATKITLPTSESEIPLLHCEAKLRLIRTQPSTELKLPPSRGVDGHLQKTLGFEGGYQNDKEDDGNYRPDGILVGTNRGITSTALSKFKKVDPNSVTVSDIKSITEEDALSIYKQDYFYGPRLDRLPTKLQASVLDMYINSGPNAVKILQGLAGMPVDKQDGVIGKDTLTAVNSSSITSKQYADARVTYYISLVKRKPKLLKYLNGWITRANKYR